MTQDIQYRVYNCICEATGPIGRQEISEATGIPPRIVSDALHKLSTRKGVVKSVGGYKQSRWVMKGPKVDLWAPSKGRNPNSLAALARVNQSGKLTPFGAGECLLAKLW